MWAFNPRPSAHPNPMTLGFSLLELIVALTVLALLVSITTFAITSADRTASFRTQTSELVRGLHLAQSTAIAGGQTSVFQLDLAEKSWRAGASAPRTIDPSFAVSLRLANDEILSATRGQIRFYSDGSSSGGIIRLQRNDLTRSIAVDWVSGAIAITDEQP